MDIKLTSSLEEYLKTIYILDTTVGQIRVTDIANKLNCTKASVNKALNNLNKLELISYQVYKDIKLTDQGRKIAKGIVKKYDVLKLFLVEVLGVAEEIASEEAKAMKFALSKETTEKLDKYINKVLDLGDLDCNYDENSEKCQNCIKLTIKNRIKKESITK